MRTVFAVFHLNLSYSSLDEGQHAEVITRCYRPLLALVQRPGIKLGVELTASTLQRIAALAPDWLEQFRQLHEAGKLELVGSGDSQLIGPLAPWPVNVWNQRLGLELYRELLGIEPRLALVNEMAYSSGLVELYAEAGYRGLLMDHDNVALALGLSSEKTALPDHALGAEDGTLPVLWTDSLLFQKLQQYAHGDIRREDYLAYLQRRAEDSTRPLALYANDAEVFDFRPGRFETESALNGAGEWQRIGDLFEQLQTAGFNFELPSELLPTETTQAPARLSALSMPVPVKKQAKYNVTRWAVTGRDDLRLNTLCHRLSQALQRDAHKADQAGYWRRLCRLWASDLRTHTTEARWQRAEAELEALAAELGVALDYGTSSDSRSLSSEQALPSGCEIGTSDDGLLMTVTTPDVQLQLNPRRGLAITRLAFRSHDFTPTLGTLPHGYFDTIDLGADFYSGHCVIDLVGERRRVTDLEWVLPQVSGLDDGGLAIRAEIATALGPIVKQIEIQGERVELRLTFPGWKTPFGTLRLGHMTLLPEAFPAPLALHVVNGGHAQEVFPIDRECDHSAPASTLVTANAGFGATDGKIAISDGEVGLSFSWDPSLSAPLPMLYHRSSSPNSLTRLLFSMAELDETAKPGGRLPGFALEIKPLACGGR